MFKYFIQIIKISFFSLFSNKVRSFLTMIGIVIGVGAVIIIMSVGAGAQSLILSQVKNLGTNLIGILPGKAEDGGPPASAMGIVITTLSYDDLKALKKVREVVDVVGWLKSVATLSWKSNSYDTTISGVSIGYMKVEGGEIEKGRFFTEDENKNISKVVVLGSAVKKELFGDSDAVGQKIKFKKHTFEVIGVMKERGTVAFQDYDDQIFIPLKTMQKIILGVNHLSLIHAKIDSEENINQVIEDFKIILREKHNIKDQSGKYDDFTVRGLTQALDMLKTITNALKYFLAAMAALSLVVGGIGIMNIMLINIKERTREIGLRKAIGANNADIMWQFLLEAIFITFIGGLIGIFFGILISFLISLTANYLGYNWDFVISFYSIFLAVFVSILVGLIFGLYPAREASKLEPIEALRYE